MSVEDRIREIVDSAPAPTPEQAEKLRHLLAPELERPQLQLFPQGQHVYFMQTETGEVKIGYAKDPEQRMRELQTGNPGEIKLLAIIDHKGPAMERELHRQFAHLRIRGEWFKPGADLLEYIESLGDMP